MPICRGIISSHAYRSDSGWFVVKIITFGRYGKCNTIALRKDTEIYSNYTGKVMKNRYTESGVALYRRSARVCKGCLIINSRDTPSFIENVQTRILDNSK